MGTTTKRVYSEDNYSGYISINSEDKSLSSLNSNRMGKYWLAPYSKDKVLAIDLMLSLYCSQEILSYIIWAPNIRAMVGPYSEEILEPMSSLYVLYPRYRHSAGRFPAEILAPNFFTFWGHIARTFCPRYRS